MQHLFDTLLNGPARWTQERHIGPGWTLIIVLGVLFAEFIGAYLLFMSAVKAVQNARAFTGWALRLCGVGAKDIPYVFLELTFPSDTTKSAFATEQLYILMRGQIPWSHFWDKLAGRKRLHSLELVSTRDDGIRYVMMVSEVESESIRRNLLSYLPGIKVNQADDYTGALTGTSVGVVEFRLTADFVLPLEDHKALSEHDPIAYLTGHMTKLAPDELAAYQIVVAPVIRHTHPRVVHRMKDMEHRLALGKELSTKLKKQRTPLGYALWLLWFPPLWVVLAFSKVIMGIGDIIGGILTSTDPSFLKTSDKRPSDNPYEQELAKTIKTKLDQHMYEVSIRLLMASGEPSVINDRLSAMLESFQPFATTYQGMRLRSHVPLLFPDSKLWPLFKERALSPHHLSQPTILSSSELSDMYHFPNTDMVKTESFVKSRSRELPAPLSIKHRDTKLDVVMGVNAHGGEEQPIGMTLAQRQKHTYVLGKTGTGKTTLLTSSIYQDMVSGKGLAVLDPHGDMFRELLTIVPEHRRKDVVVFDPSDRAYPLGLNMLDPGVEFADEDDRREWITSVVLSVFERLADERQWGPRMEHILRNATMTALHLPNPSLYTLQRLLTDKKYQREVTEKLKDPVLKQFWEKEFKLMGSMQMSTVTAPLTHRLGHFITTKMSRHILLQKKSTLRIGDIMNEGKILLVNLSKGDVGEDQSFFFGTILTSFIWMAAYQRTKIPEKDRWDFFLYVDEFQNFATKQFTDITSEGRKFHISLIASHQNIAQIEDKSILKIVAGNSHSMICLKASPEDEEFILPYMEPVVEKGDIVNLTPYHFFMKTTADESEDAFSGKTVPLDVEGSSKTKTAVLAYSRKRYGTPKKTVEKYMDELFASKEPEKKGQIRKKSQSSRSSQKFGA